MALALYLDHHLDRQHSSESKPLLNSSAIPTKKPQWLSSSSSSSSSSAAPSSAPSLTSTAPARSCSLAPPSACCPLSAPALLLSTTSISWLKESCSESEARCCKTNPILYLSQPLHRWTNTCKTNSFYPATSAISEWFNHKRGLALGIALSGSSVGGIFWPIIINKLFASVPGPWVHRIIALISVPVLLVSCFLVRERKVTPTTTVVVTDTEANLSGSVTSPGSADKDKLDSTAETREGSGILEAVCERRFGALCLSLFFIYGGMLIPFYYIPLFAIEHGLGATMANNLLAIGYAGSVVGRVGSGWIADRFGR